MCFTIRTARFAAAVTLRDHVKRHITGQCPPGRAHRDVTGSRSRRNRSFYVRIGNNREDRRSSIERDACSPRKSLTKNPASLADFAGIAYECDEGAKTHVETEDGTETIRPA